MTSYYSTFITGTQEIVRTALKEKLKDTKVKLFLDGLVVYHCQGDLEKIKNLRFFNNSYLLLLLLKGKLTTQVLIRKTLRNPSLLSDIQTENLKGVKNFRVVASQENQIVSIDKQLLGKIETLLSKKLGLKVNRALPDVEIWFLTRSEGFGLVGLRITKTPNYEKTLHKGELRPELAHIMCLLAELKPLDVVLDPFAGYGAIPMECIKAFSVRQVVASEKDKGVFKVLQVKMSQNKKKVVLGRWNALKLSSLTNNSMDKIITDPPWGFYDNRNIDLRKFYKRMFDEFIRVLKPNGLMIILTAQKELLGEIIASFSNLELLKRYDILVSGKKSAIYKIKLTAKLGTNQEVQG